MRKAEFFARPDGCTTDSVQDFGAEFHEAADGVLHGFVECVAPNATSLACTLPGRRASHGEVLSGRMARAAVEGTRTHFCP